MAINLLVAVSSQHSWPSVMLVEIPSFFPSNFDRTDKIKALQLYLLLTFFWYFSYLLCFFLSTDGYLKKATSPPSTVPILTECFSIGHFQTVIYQKISVFRFNTWFLFFSFLLQGGV
jgi:hypothetical protein